MLEWVRNAFRGFFNVVLWLCLIGFTIGGGIVGYGMGEGGGAFLGVILGLLFGLVFDIITGGLIATILKMDENLEILKNQALKTGSSSSGNSSGTNSNSSVPVNPPVVNTGDTWVCKNCGERNPNTASSCKGCGSYK